MNQGFKLLFLLKKGHVSKKGTLPVYVRITIDGKRIEWSIQKSCEPSKWDQDKGRAIGTKTEVIQLNNYLNTIQHDILDVQHEYALRKEPLDVSVFRKRFIEKEEEVFQTIIKVYQEHNDQFEKLSGTEYSWGSFKKFKTALVSLKNFISWKFKKADVGLNEINHQFITDYEFYLKSEQGMQHNSAMSNMKKLKKIVRICVANDWMTKDPFKSYRITTQETFRNFLLMGELENLISKPFSMSRLDQVRDIFVFSCYTVSQRGTPSML
jgi:hypothetical protein